MFFKSLATPCCGIILPLHIIHDNIYLISVLLIPSVSLTNCTVSSTVIKEDCSGIRINKTISKNENIPKTVKNAVITQPFMYIILSNQ